MTWGHFVLFVMVVLFSIGAAYCSYNYNCEQVRVLMKDGRTGVVKVCF